MQPLSREEALALLNLTAEASKDEIEGACRRLAPVYHPDKGGTDEAFTRLRMARDVALELVENPDARALVQTSASLSLVHREIQAHRAMVEASSVMETTRRRRTQRLYMLSLVSILATAISSMLAIAWEKLIPQLAPTPITTIAALRPYIAWFIPLFALVGIFAGLAVRIIRIRLERYAEALSDLETCAQELAKVLGFNDVTAVTQRDVVVHSGPKPDDEREVDNPFATLGLQFSVGDEAKTALLFQKAKEHGLLVPHEIAIMRPGMTQSYAVCFQPSRFKLEQQSKSEKHEWTRENATFHMWLFLVPSLAFGLWTTYLIVFKGSKWAYLTGLCTISFLIQTIVGIVMRNRHSCTGKDSAQPSHSSNGASRHR